MIPEQAPSMADDPMSTVQPAGESMPPVLKNPFGNIALAFSGGGFRAASFSLGVISYLNRLHFGDRSQSLLKQVSFITSTSGGTLTNAFYSQSLSKPGFSFEVFYNKMKDALVGEVILDEVFRILNNPDCWNEVGVNPIDPKAKDEALEKSHNLINAFAKAYDNLLFNDSNAPGSNYFGQLLDRTQNPHLRSVCFNATELNNGMSFRFQADAMDARIVGNSYLRFKKIKDQKVSPKLKISDMVAASSCFPSGFEPIIYPKDFVHPEMNNLKEMAEAIAYQNNNPLNTAAIVNEPFSLVDGGVVDNQGLYSIMMEDDIRIKKNATDTFDLMMICDVGSYFLKAFETPAQSDAWWGKLTIRGLTRWLPVGLLIFIGSFLLSILGYGIWKNIGLLLVLPSLAYSCIYFYCLLQWANIKGKVKNNSFGKAILSRLGYFGKLKLSVLVKMLAARLGSTVLLATDVFLKQERRQYYSTIYATPKFKDRVLSCFIYEFSDQHANRRNYDLATKDHQWYPEKSGPLTPSVMMTQMATKATAVPTTLWFESGPKQPQRDEVIACGQFTMCYCLLKHIYRLEATDKKWEDNAQLQTLKQQLINDWDAFCNNPMFMVK